MVLAPGAWGNSTARALGPRLRSHAAPRADLGLPLAGGGSRSTPHGGDRFHPSLLDPPRGLAVDPHWRGARRDSRGPRSLQRGCRSRLRGPLPRAPVRPLPPLRGRHHAWGMVRDDHDEPGWPSNHRPRSVRSRALCDARRLRDLVQDVPGHWQVSGRVDRATVRRARSICGPSAPRALPRARRGSTRTTTAGAGLFLAEISSRESWGASAAPQTPQRSGRPGKPGAPLVTRAVGWLTGRLG